MVIVGPPRCAWRERRHTDIVVRQVKFVACLEPDCARRSKGFTKPHLTPVVIGEARIPVELLQDGCSRGDRPRRSTVTLVGIARRVCAQVVTIEDLRRRKAQGVMRCYAVYDGFQPVNPSDRCLVHDKAEDVIVCTIQLKGMSIGTKAPRRDFSAGGAGR